MECLGSAQNCWHLWDLEPLPVFIFFYFFFLGNFFGDKRIQDWNHVRASGKQHKFAAHFSFCQECVTEKFCFMPSWSWPALTTFGGMYSFVLKIRGCLVLAPVWQQLCVSCLFWLWNLLALFVWLLRTSLDGPRRTELTPEMEEVVAFCRCPAQSSHFDCSTA